MRETAGQVLPVLDRDDPIGIAVLDQSVRHEMLPAEVIGGND